MDEVLDAVLKKYHLPAYDEPLLMYFKINEINDPLNLQEHEIIFDYLWNISNQKHNRQIDISSELKRKILGLRQSIPRFHVLPNQIFLQDEIGTILINGALKPEEKVELWSIFQQTTTKISRRNYGEILENISLDHYIEPLSLGKYPAKVLDFGCGPEGRGISTIVQAYLDRIEGYGVDLIITDHPANVRLHEVRNTTFPFQNSFFDLTYSCVVFYYLNEKEIKHNLGEILRVLKPHSNLVFDDERKLDFYRHILSTLKFKTETEREHGDIVVHKIK